MWTWPLNSVMEVTIAHKAPERVTNGTCTQVWAWMTNKCRKRMDQRKGYITSEISHKRGGAPRKAPREIDEMGIHILGRGVLSPGRWAVWFCILSSYLIILIFPHKPLPHQNPTFGPTLYKFIVMGPLGLDSVRRWAWLEHRDPTQVIYKVQWY